MCKYNSSCTKHCTTTCVQDTCGCLSKYSGECIIYDGEELTCTNIAVGLNFNDLIKELDEYFCLFKNEIQNFISILNLGTGARVYRDDNLLGQKQLRSLLSLNDSLTISEETDEITFEVQQSSETQSGAIEIATQIEVDAGVDTERAVTPSTLTTFLSNPANLPLPVATELQQGIAEIATQAEVDTGTDDERFVTPLKLANYTFPPAVVPNATEIERGIAEIATQAETDAGVDDERFVTPLKLANYAPLQFVNKAVVLPYTLLPADNGAVLYTTGTGDITVPASLGSEFECGVIQQDMGTVTFVGSGGAILLIPAGLTNEIEGINYQAYVRSNVNANTFNILGNLTSI